MNRRIVKDTGWRLFLRTVLGRAYPRVVGQNREKSWVFFEVLMPLLAVSAYVFVYRAIRAPEDFIGFVIVGGAMVAFWANVLWSMSTQFYWDKEQGMLALYVLSPTSLIAILLGMALGGLFATSLRALAIIVIGSLLFSVQYAVGSLPLLLLVFALAMTALYGLGMMFASLFLIVGREGQQLANMLQEPVYFLSGMYFPIRSLNFWVAAAASLIPLTLGLDAMRQLVFKSGPALGFLDVRLEAAILAALSVAFLWTARWLLGYIERLAVQEGRITESRG